MTETRDAFRDQLHELSGQPNIKIHMQEIATIFFFLQTAVSAPLPSNVLIDDILARYERAIRDNLAVSDLPRVIP